MRRLKPIDIVVLKKLSDVVNVVPVIAKSDSLTMEERAAFKERIKEEFAFHNLKMYPYDNDELDEEERALNAQIKNIIPFAVVGSEKSIIVDGKQVRGRQNRWGVINGVLLSLPRTPLSAYADLRSREREPLRVRVLAKFPHAYPSARPHRDNFADPLRDIPC